MTNIEMTENSEIMEEKSTRNAERRKNEWKFAMRRKELVDRRFGANKSLQEKKIMAKPLHYFSKNPPLNGYAEQPKKTRNKGGRRYISKNYAPSINWCPNDRRRIDSIEGQLAELCGTE